MQISVIDGKPATRGPHNLLKGPVAFSKGKPMSKGNNKRGNKEARKPKQVKPKNSATTDSSTGKPFNIGASKKVK